MIPWLLLITTFAVMLNLGYAGLQVALLRRRRSWPRVFAIAILAWALLMAGLFALQVFVPFPWKAFVRHWLYFPLAVEMVWNLLFIQLLFLGMILVTLALRWFRPVKPSEPVLTEEGLTRRKFLYLAAYGAAPAAAIGLGVHGTATRADLRVNDMKVAVPGLPPELEGFTIAHVSDLHSGLFVGEKRLKKISDTTNDLKAQLVVVTGDIINNEMPEFPAALAAIQRMEAPLGTYLCEGNHDLIPGPGVVLNACRANRLAMLYDGSVALPVNGRRLLVGGFPWMHSGFHRRDLVARLFPQRQEGDVRLLLAHHPHILDVAEDADLVLSGHSHGGQIMVGEYGLGRLFFHYWSGYYRRGNTAMVVSNGCGDWFPCRIGAPAEIGLLRLTAAS